MNDQIKCVKLKQKGYPTGNHILLPFGATLCGCITVDYDKSKIPDNLKDIASEYTVVEWHITCKKCIEMVDIVKDHKKRNS